MKIALDGPAGAGKSTVAKAIAKQLDIMYLDTGAMYRTIGLYMDRAGISPQDEKNVEKALDSADFSVKYIAGAQHVFLKDEDVSEKIRENRVSALASAYSALGCVRKYLVKMQQETAAKQDCILDGRDIGTCVLPDADFKFFLTADSSERARRRAEELKQKGQDFDLDALKKEIEQRDYNDSHRAISPLVRAEDAVLVDSTNLNIEQTVEYIINIIKEGR